MTITDQESNQVVAEVLAAEQARCDATGADDWEALNAILSDDFTYTHANGVTDSKTSYVASMKLKDHKLTRGEVTVRLYGEVAVTNGELFSYSGPQPDGTPAKTNHYLVIQVWVKRGDGWQIVAYQSLKPQLRAST